MVNQKYINPPITVDFAIVYVPTEGLYAELASYRDPKTKELLMEELRKVVRVMAKLDDTAPHEVMLVLDAGTGQNALAQAKSFQSVVGVTGLTLTKLDGTA